MECGGRFDALRLLKALRRLVSLLPTASPHRDALCVVGTAEPGRVANGTAGVDRQESRRPERSGRLRMPRNLSLAPAGTA
jgi:hypothetical protein